MADKIEVTGIKIKINGNKATLSIEEAWRLKRELDKLLHTESVPYPYLVYPGPYIPYVPYTEPYIYPTRGDSSGGFSCEIVDSETVGLLNTF